MSNKIIITRADLYRIFQDHNLVVIFEALINQVSNLLPSDIASLTISINTAQIAADNAQIAANTAQSTANTAQTTANTAQSTADAAQAAIAALGDMANQNSTSVSITGGTITATLTNNTTDFLSNSVTLTNYAGAATVNAFTNSPVAGNPTKWIGINDNGTVRRIPTW